MSIFSALEFLLCDLYKHLCVRVADVSADNMVLLVAIISVRCPDIDT